MKILIISPSFFPIVGGTEVAIHEISRRLLQRGHDVTILTPKYPELRNSKICEKMDAGQVYRFPVSGYMYKFSALTRYIDIQLRAFKKIIELDENEDFDILHQFHLFALGGGVILAKKLIRKPLITTLGGWDTYDPINPVPKIFFPYLKWVMMKSDALTSISKNLATYARLQGYKGNIQMIPYGVDAERIRRYVMSESAGEKNIKIRNLKGNIILLSVHRLVPRKATSYLLKAFRMVVNKNKNARLLIIGEGPERERLENFAEKLDIKSYVLFLGKVDHDKVWKYYALSDIFVLHTLYEGLGVVLLEAMMCEKPVITTIAGATIEVVEHGKTGLLISPRNPDALANAIMGLIEDEELRIRMGIEGRKKVEREYDWDVIVDNYLKLYEET